MKKLILVLSLVILPFLMVFSQENSKAKIFNILDKQAMAWNNGDIETFMEGYWKSEELKFIGKTGVTKGWKATYERYKKSYPNIETMGKLKFDNLNIEFFGKKTAYIVGSWNLTRPTKGDVGGYFTLVFKKVNRKWKIIIDHTS